jgi:iron complex outermembrane recepter protein
VLPVDHRGREADPSLARFSARFFIIAALALAPALFCGLQTTSAQTTSAQTLPAQTPRNPNALPSIRITARAKRQGQVKKPKAEATAPAPPNNAQLPSQPLAGIPMIPLNTVTQSATRLGLPVIQTPASLEVVDQKTMQEQGYRTTTETAQGAVGVLAGDSAGAPANFSMRGFAGPQVNVLYNGIWTGPTDITSRWMDTANLAQVEFLKGPSSLMSGLNAIGGAVNYVSRQPTSGPIRNEMDAYLDSYGSFRSHFGSGGSTPVRGLDYRFDVSGARYNSFIEGDFRDITGVATQLNYRVTDAFKTFLAIEYKKDSGHAYWGTPVVPVSFAGSHAVNGVVSGTAINTFDGSVIGPLTIDSRTLTTNYNVADNATGAQELWLRSGFEWQPLNNVTIKDQLYSYQAKRNWLDSETYAFSLTAPAGMLPCPGAQPTCIDRDRFAVFHNQNIFGNNADLTWDSFFFGMENRFVAQLQTSSNRITFKEDISENFPDDTVSVVNPQPGVYGPLQLSTRNSKLDDVAGAFEDRLKLTPAFALIGGVRVDRLTLSRDGVNADGTVPAGLPFIVSWEPVSYRAAYTYEPIPNLMFYSMYATAYNPAVAAVFSITPGTSLQLTSSRIYETGAKQILWNGKAEWTVALYDIVQRNVFFPISTTQTVVAGEVTSKGIELAAAVAPIDGLKLWGNAAVINARFGNFGAFTGNVPPNVAPLIVNAGASYRFGHWRWPLEIGGSMRYVGNRFLEQDNLTTLNAYTTADAYAFLDIPGRDLAMPQFDNVRISARVRNLTNAVYAAWSDTTYPDQILLGAPRTYEIGAAARW